MDANLLRQAGEALYGSRWQTDLARDLKVADRTVRRWAVSGDVPPGAWAEIRVLLRDRGAAIAAVRRQIPRVLPPKEKSPPTR